MGIKTTTEWSASGYYEGDHCYASLARAINPNDHAVLVVNGKRINLDASQLDELSEAADLIAGEIKES